MQAHSVKEEPVKEEPVRPHFGRRVMTGGAGMGALLAVPQTARARCQAKRRARPAFLPVIEPDQEPEANRDGPGGRQLAAAAGAAAVRAWEHLIARAWRLGQIRKLWAAVGTYLQEVKRRGRELQ